MTPVAAIALAVAAPFAFGNWWSKVRNDRRPKPDRLEYLSKPAVLVAFVVAAVALDPAAGAGDRRAWFVVALVFSLAGDVLLMLPDRFVAGLGAFLVAHLCYIAGLWTDPPAAAALAVAALTVVVAVGSIATRIVGALRVQGERALVVPVVAYIAVISAMLASALASGNLLAAVGALLFAASDSLIAWNQFVRPRAGAGVTIMVTYHLGQLLLVCSLLD